MKKLHLLILATGAQPKLIDSIVKRGHTYELFNPNELYLFVSESENGHDRIYWANPEFENPVRIKAGSFDAIISRIGDNLNHGAAILRHLNENLGIPSVQNAEGLLTASNKLKSTQRFSYHGLRVPKTIYAKNPVHVDFLIKKLGDLPIVAKLLQGSQGVGVSILETPLSANTVLESFAKLKADVKLQAFIKANGKDIRAIVIGDSVSVAMERTANKGDFRANISKNGSGRKVELSEDDTKICIRAARSIGLSFAGIDIMKDEEGRTYVIEANGNSGSKIIGITGHNYFDDLVLYAEKIALKASQATATDSKDTKQSNTPSASRSTVGITTNIDDLRIKYPKAMKGF